LSGTAPQEIPQEISEFLRKARGILLVTGTNGSGKTIFALELGLLHEQAIIISPLLDSIALQDTYPAFGEAGSRFQVIDGSILARDRGSTTFSKFLVDEINHTIPPATTRVLIVRNPEAFLTLPGVVEDVDSPFTVLKDIIDMLECQAIIISDLVEDASFVSFVDCIVSLEDLQVESRRFWELTILKARSIAIHQQNYLYTLARGRFTVVPPPSALDLNKVGPWVLEKDPEGCYSTGSQDLDKLLGCGLMMGSFNVVEIDPAVPNTISALFLAPAVNFLLNGRGVITWFLSGLNSTLLHKKDLALLVDADVMLEKFRIIDEKSSNIVENRPYVVQINDRREDLFTTFVDTYDLLESSSRFQPVLSIMEYGAILHTETGVLQLIRHAAFVKNSNTIEIAIVAGALDDHMATALDRIADTHIRIQYADNAIVVSGKKPWTGFFGFVAQPLSSPCFKLLEIL
jgi:hypothetical protein